VKKVDKMNAQNPIFDGKTMQEPWFPGDFPLNQSNDLWVFNNPLCLLEKTFDVKITVFGMKVHVSGTHLFCGGQEGTNPMKGWWITASDTVPVLRSAFANHLYDEGRFPLLHD
jgi:hypothetical protein